jgi:ubiquitin
MEIFVKTLTGRTIKIVASSRVPIIIFKQLVIEKEGIPADEQRIIFYKWQLEDNRTLGDYDVQTYATFHLMLRLKGC